VLSKFQAALAPYSKFIVALVGVSAKTVGQFVAVVVAAVGVYLKANAPKAEA